MDQNRILRTSYESPRTLPSHCTVNLTQRKLKSSDVKQAFVQATLPSTKKYVFRPPAGCPISKPNTYWLLNKCTLYGLKRSPRHWYEKSVKLLNQAGLQQCPNAPCLFTGTIIPGLLPLFLFYLL